MAYGLTKSLDFEFGSAQYADAGDTVSLSITGDLTLECWANFESLPADGDRRGLMWKWNGTNQRSYAFHLRNSGGTYQLNGQASSNGTADAGFFDDVVVNWTPSVDTWYHLALSIDPGVTSAFKFYVNGAQQGSTQTGVITGIFDGTSPFQISENSGGIYMDGEISLVRVWSVIRTEEEIAANMCNVFGGAETNMAAEWSLDDVLTDASGNGNTLTAVNSPAFVSNVPATCTVVVGGRDARHLTLLGVG